MRNAQKPSFWYLSAGAALLLFLTAGNAAAECHHCEEDMVECRYITYPDDPEHVCENPTELLQAHRFPISTFECENGGGGGGGSLLETANCRACGNSSRCHWDWEEGECHEACSASLAAAGDVLRAIKANDAQVLAQLIAANPGVALHPEGQAVRLLDMGACASAWLQDELSLSIESARTEGVRLSESFSAEVADAIAKLGLREQPAGL